MKWLVVKYLLTSAMIVFISEMAKRNDKIGGLVAALPMLTITTLIWLHIEQQSQEKIANHAWYTFWYVIPTLPMFLIFPKLLVNIGFWPALLVSAVVSVVCFVLFAKFISFLGVEII